MNPVETDVRVRWYNTSADTPVRITYGGQDWLWQPKKGEFRWIQKRVRKNVETFNKMGEPIIQPRMMNVHEMECVDPNKACPNYQDVPREFSVHLAKIGSLAIEEGGHSGLLRKATDLEAEGINRLRDIEANVAKKEREAMERIRMLEEEIREREEKVRALPVAPAHPSQAEVLRARR